MMYIDISRLDHIVAETECELA